MGECLIPGTWNIQAMADPLEDHECLRQWEVQESRPPNPPVSR